MSGHAAARRELVVIGASAGGVAALTQVVRDLPPDLHAAVCIVLHIAPGSPSMLASILDRAGRLPCRPAHDGERLREGTVLVAPPDHHLVIQDGRVHLTVGPRENGLRPAIDVLFRSAASALDGRVVGVVLTGMMDDGSAGLAMIKASGGATIVQDPSDAAYPAMPASAIAKVSVDAIVPAAMVGRAIAAMVNGEDLPPDVGAGDPESEPERDPVGNPVGKPMGDPPGESDPPDDPGEGEQLAAVLGRLAQQAERRGQPRSARRFRRQVQSASEQAEIVRTTLAGAAGTTLRRVADTDDAERDVGAQEGAA